MNNINRIFVYGTLQSHSWNHDLLEGYESFKPGKVNGQIYYAYMNDKEDHLINIPVAARSVFDGECGVPVMFDNAPGIVSGEVYEFTPEEFEYVLPDLDRLESLPPGKLIGNCYQRKIVNVTLEDGAIVQAWAYPASPNHPMYDRVQG